MMLHQCPVPGCNHIAPYISNAHTTSHHGITRKHMINVYGSPLKMREDPVKARNNLYKPNDETTAPKQRHDKFKRFSATFRG